MYKKIIFIIAFFVGIYFPAQAQQNIQFTQYLFNSLSVNPAYAGYKEQWFAQVAYRSQWTGFKGAPKTFQASIDGILDPITKNMGLGLQITNDRLGPQVASSVYGTYAYRLRLNEEDTKRLSFGIGVGLSQYRLKSGMLDPNDPVDPLLINQNLNSLIPDVRFGVYYYTPKWYVGLSIMDLFSGGNSNNLFQWEDHGIENLHRKRHLYLIGGALFPLSEKVSLLPGVLVKEDFKGPTSVDIHAMFIFNDRFWFGGSFRTSSRIWNKNYKEGMHNLRNPNAAAGIIQFFINDRLRVGYSYDFVVSKLSSVQHGSHEITLGITFPGKSKRVLSPRFF